MRSSWAQPSLSRDFILLSASILFVLMLISGWVTYRTYEKHYDHITIDLEKEIARIESTISTEMENANYMLASLGRQIVVSSDLNYTRLAQSLKSFDTKNHIYSIFSWTNTDKKMVVSSNKGVLEEPVDISDRDFIQQSATDSWKMHIGRPIEGRVSGRWVIPVSMGITDYTGKFIGIISLSIDIKVLTEQISNLIKRNGVSFAIVSKNLVTLAEVSDSKNFINDNFPAQKISNIDFDKNPSGLISKGNLIWGTGVYTYYRVSENFPYIVLMGYDANSSDEPVRVMLWSRLMQIITITIFFVLFLWIIKVRIVKPVINMTAFLASVARGECLSSFPQNLSLEIDGLATQIRQVSKYIDETKRIENELRNKVFLLKKAKEDAELNMRNKSEFLVYIAQEMRMPINNIIGFSQVLKDQIYGAIENKKYRQYSNDIFTISNQLIAKIQDIIIHSKMESGHLGLQEKPLDISNSVNGAIRQVTDKLQTTSISIKTNLQESLPHLFADDFRLQQIIVNLLLIISDHTTANESIELEVKIINEHRDRQFLALIICNSNIASLSQDKLFILADKLFTTNVTYNSNGNMNVNANDSTDLRLELAKLLIIAHGAVLHIDSIDEEIRRYIVFFPASRIVFQETSD